MLEFINVSKSFWTGTQRKVILDRASFRVELGQSLGILAPNGTGKTTLINMMAGLEKPDEGEIIRGCRISFPLGFMGGVLPKLSATENSRYIAQLYGLDPDYVEAFCRWVCDLEEYFDRPLGTYSAGMKARFQFSLLLALEFDIYLIDEGMPRTTDATFNRKAGSILADRLKTATVIIVSHQAETLEKFARRAAVLKDGQFYQFDSLEEAKNSMTTKPKGKKFRIRRTGPTAPAGETRRVVDNSLGGPVEDGFGDTRFPTAGAPPPQQPQPQQRQTQGLSIEEELAAIRTEGLTGRQLRMARRTAQKHGLQPASDFDAVRLLRRQGIDPFERSNMLELVVNEGEQRPDPQNRLPATVRQPSVPAQAPQTAPAMAPPPSLDDAARAQEILRMQRDIANRRRKRLALLFARLMAFVMLPTMLVGYYYYNIATPMFATNTLFQIQKAESASPAGGLGGLLGGTTFATVQDSIAVQSFLESREAMLLLDEELGLREHFSSPEIDPLNRLAPDASIEDLYALYSRNLTIGYDPTEGMVRMEVLAADPQLSAAFSGALLRYAEERVDQMSHRLREDQMAGARESYDAAEDALAAAQMRVVNLQEQSGVLSSEAEVGALFNQISTFEIQLQNERLRLDELQSVDRPNQTRVEVAERNIARLDALITQLRSSMTQGQATEVSLARISSELMVAQADLQTRQLMLSQSLQALEGARLEAERQSLYLTISVNPIAPDEAAFPRKLENTLLAFLIFSGIYLMLSMTASILREQVSA